MNTREQFLTALAILAALAVATIVFTEGIAPLLVKEEGASPAAFNVIAPPPTVAVASYKRPDGSTWRVPIGRYDFQVSSQTIYPQFVSGVIDPPDVRPGDTQRMEVVIRSDAPLRSVVAFIDHDEGTDTVPLVLVRSTPITQESLDRGGYLVDGNGALIVDEAVIRERKSLIINALVASAAAEGVVEYIFGGEWLVHSVHIETYRTRFVATDEQNRKNELTLAWSDACSVDPSNALAVSCSLTAETDGIDGASLSIGPSISLTVNAGATFGFNPGRSITLSGGQIVLGGGNVARKYVHYQDADGDSYPSGAVRTLSDAPSLAGYVRMSAAPGGRIPQIDCVDSGLAQANIINPGQTGYFSVHRGDGSFDYNCNGVTPSYGNGDKAGLAQFTGEIIPSNSTMWTGPPKAACGSFQVVDGISGPQGNCGQTWATPDGYCSGGSGFFEQSRGNAFSLFVDDLLGDGVGGFLDTTRVVRKVRAAILGVGFYADEACSFCVGQITSVCR